MNPTETLTKFLECWAAENWSEMSTYFYSRSTCANNPETTKQLYEGIAPEQIRCTDITPVGARSATVIAAYTIFAAHMPIAQEQRVNLVPGSQYDRPWLVVPESFRPV